MSDFMQMDFTRDWEDILRSRLSALGHPPDAADDVRALSRRFFNLQKRRIEPRPRTAVRSREFSCPAERLPVVQELSDRSRRGEDLWPYLSTTLSNVEFNDDLLNDWGIHHFHLGDSVGAGGFVTRSGPLLFARVTTDRLLLITVASHADFSMKRLVGIIHTNWPDEIAQYRLPRVLRLPEEVAEDGVKELRKAGIGAIIRVPDGTVYMPIGGGAATSRVAQDVLEATASSLQFVKSLEAHVQEHAAEFIQDLAGRNRRPSEPRLIMLLDDTSAYAFEEASPDVLFALAGLRKWLLL